MTLLSAMAEVETAAKQRFVQNVVKVVFVLSPVYAALPEPLQFVYTMVTTIAEGRFNENEQGRTVRKNMTLAEEDLMAMALRTKPHNN